MNILIFGSTGGSGRVAVTHLLADGHHVTAFARRTGQLAAHPHLREIAGDVMDPAAVDRAMPGHDAVVVALGIRENPLRVRLRGPARTPADVRSAGTRHIIAAMRAHAVRRLVVQTSFGVGATRPRLRWIERLFFWLILKPQIADTEIQEREVTASGLDWLVVQPVHLTDAAGDAAPFASAAGATARMSVSRASVGRFLARAVGDPALTGQVVAVSGAAA